MVEFDIFFGHMDKKRYQYGQEITVNWQTRNIEGKGVFYTDANALRMVKRDTRTPPKDPKSAAMNVPGFFYPVNSALFIEDTYRALQFAVIPDRPQSASAYHTAPTEGSQGSRIEYLFMRRTVGNDALGVAEAMDDQVNGQPMNYTGKYWLTFTTERRELYDIVHKKHIGGMNQGMMFNTLSYRVGDAKGEKDAELEKRKQDFLSYLNSSSIQDLQLIPSPDLSSLYLRLYRYIPPRGQVPLSTLTLT